MKNLENLVALTEQIPSPLKENAAALLEEMSTVIEGVGDQPVEWRPGFLRLVQGTTDRSSIPKGTGIGDFVIGEEKVDQPLHFIPLRMWDGRQYWDPDQTSNKMLCWSPDAKFGQIGRECKSCEFATWVEGEGSACTKNKTVLAITSKLDKIFTVTFAKSNYKSGMELEGMMKKAAVNPYARTYGLGSTTSPTAKNIEVYKVEVLDDKLRRTPSEQIPFLKGLFDRVSEDRKAMIDAFYENAKKKQEQLALSGEKQLAIEGKTGGDATTIEVKADKEDVSSLTTNYQV